MKKICMIVPSFDAKGGIASVVSGYRGSALEAKYCIHYIETYCDGSKWAKLYKAICAYLKFVGELLFFKPDLVHIHSSFGASFYRKLPFIYLTSFCRIPIVNHIHGSEIDKFYHNTTEKDKRRKRKAFEKCQKIIALADEWREKFSVFAEKEKIEVIGNYSVLREIRQEDRKGKNNVLFLGFLSELKGCFDIPEIVSLVKQKVEGVTFILAGSGLAADVQEINRNIQLHNVEDSILFPGWVRMDEKNKLLEEASIYFLPSYTEGMPMSILEAMGYGLPIVSTNVGGIPTLVSEGDNGYLCEPGDIRGMADAIVKILSDEEKRINMGQASAAIVEENYSLKRHVEQLSRVYESIA